MFSLSESNKFMVCTSAVDLRKGVEPLSRMVRSDSMSPTDGSVYVFFNTILPRLHANMTKEEYESLLPYRIAEELKK